LYSIDEKENTDFPILGPPHAFGNSRYSFIDFKNSSHSDTVKKLFS